VKSAKLPPDIDDILEDICQAADIHEPCCLAAIACGENFCYAGFGDIDLSGGMLLDAAGGFMPVLCALALVGQGELTPFDPVSMYIPPEELVLPEGLTVTHLLRRAPGLPDPLRERLLPELHSLPEFAALGGDEMLRREHAAILRHRSFAHQVKLLDGKADAPCTSPAVSPLGDTLLCEIVRRISGRSLTDFAQEYIFSPLNITASPAIPEETVCCLSYAQSRTVEFSPPADTNDVFHISYDDLFKLTRAMGDGFPLSQKQWDVVIDAVPQLRSVPFVRRQGMLCAHSEICGTSVDIFTEEKSGLRVLIAAPKPLLPRLDGVIYRRFDTDVMDCINEHLVCPAHTRMERLSARNIPSASALSVNEGQRDFVAAPAVIIADASERCEDAVKNGGREVFVITDGGVTVGLLSLIYEPELQRGRLDSLLIDKRFQRRGFGGIAVDWVIRHLRRNGYGQVIVCVDRRNLAAHLLYEAQGFRLAAVHNSAYVMELDLRKK